MDQLLLVIKTLEELPPECMAEIIQACDFTEEEYEDAVEDDIEYLMQLINEYGESKESKSSYSIDKTYTFCTDNYEFACSGYNYLKDQCICDFQWHDTIVITNLVLWRAEQAVK